MKELKLINTYKIYFEEFGESYTLYEWSNNEKSYFTHIHDHHFICMTGKYCLGGTKEEAINKLKEDIIKRNGYIND